MFNGLGKDNRFSIMFDGPSTAVGRHQANSGHANPVSVAVPCVFSFFSKNLNYFLSIFQGYYQVSLPSRSPLAMEPFPVCWIKQGHVHQLSAFY